MTAAKQKGFASAMMTRPGSRASSPSRETPIPSAEIHDTLTLDLI
jgi:hypothetical protein